MRVWHWGEGLLTEPRTAAQPWRRELAFMPPFASFAERCTSVSAKEYFPYERSAAAGNQAAGTPGHAPGGCAGRCVPGQSARQYEARPYGLCCLHWDPRRNAHGACQMLYRHGWSVTL